ncbi:MAG: pyruvate kinase [Candidatus Moranbacteria bacterium]|nr:pyruvate kinase [Candidatus Moranbacteria bacterium]
MKATKIVATIGPASESEEMLERLFSAGVNVCRLNFSHGSHEWHSDAIGRIRSVSDRLGVHVGVLADLQGPRIRTLVSDEIVLESDQRVVVVGGMPSGGDELSIGLDCPRVVANFVEGHEILIEDGLMRLRVVSSGTDRVEAVVIDGGVVKNHKGINVPDTDVPLASLTEKDLSDLAFVLDEGVDFVALSFVRRGADVRDLRARILSHLGDRAEAVPQIVSKVERKEALLALPEILRETDVVMVARGDLGIEAQPSRVTIFQKEIIAQCLKAARPVIVATQMLDSMIRNPRPTRAEVSDVSNAVIDHADAVMLSGETAGGAYPFETVSTMSAIIRDTEESPFDDVLEALETTVDSDYVSVLRGAYDLARHSQARAILLFSHSGFTARLMSHFRPQERLYVATDEVLTARQLALVWGVRSYVTERTEDPYKAIVGLIDRLKKEDRLKVGDSAVIVLGALPGVGSLRLVGVQVVE